MIRVVRLGSPRAPGEGPRLGTVRRPPRGVRRQDYARRDYFDVWLPDLAPSAAAVARVLGQPRDAARWRAFVRRYRREMSAPAPRRLLATLALLSRSADFAVGCYCEDPAFCHRTVLAALLVEAGAEVQRD